MVRSATTRVKIIVNADDFGYTPGVSAGILLAFEEGILSSTTAMMNTTSVLSAVELARREVPELPIGVHLVLTYGRPLSKASEVPTLVDATGSFHRLAVLRADPTRVAAAQVEVEWRRQIERLAGLGVEVDHLDSHHHVSYLHPSLAEVMVSLAREYGVPVRCPPPDAHLDVIAMFAEHGHGVAEHGRGVWTPDLFVGDLIDESSEAIFLSLVRALPDHVIAEFMVHPAVVDAQLCAVSGYAHPRGPELDTLLAPGLPQRLRHERVELVGFRAGRLGFADTPS